MRPLYDDGASEAKEATRDYVLELDAARARRRSSRIFGGKITTYRRLAEEALAPLERVLPASSRKQGWTARAPLPGGDFPVDGLRSCSSELSAALSVPCGRATPPAGARLRHEGRIMLWARAQAADLGALFGADLTERRSAI